jgi:hypothetical protein
MSVYVDSIFAMVATKDAEARRVGGRTGHRWCHMMADTAEELHAMADTIGLKRAWFQGDHYDLTPGRRVAALRAGALEVDSRFLVQLRRRRR